MMEDFARSYRHRSPAEIDDAVLTVSEREAGKIEWPMSRRGGTLFGGLALIVLALLGGRLLYLNAVKGDWYVALAERNRQREIVLPAPRGGIYDRFGTPLLDNVPSIDAFIIPAELPTGPERDRQLADIRSLLKLEEADWAGILSLLDLGKPFPVKRTLSQEEIILVMNRSREWPGLALAKTARRAYPDGTAFAHLIGYEGRIQPSELSEYPDYLLTDSVGKQGLEKSYERDLRGVHGAQPVEVDALGRFQRSLGIKPPTPGKDLLLHVDAELQKKMYATLSAWLEEHHLRQAAAIALDPRDGSILSLVSLPSFDNNLFARGITRDEYAALSTDPTKPLFNRAISGMYPPGSTIKPVYAAAALAEGTIRPETTIESRGGITVGKAFFGDWKAHGFTDLRRAIAVSSDVYFYSIGGGYGAIRGLGIERLKRYAELFGLGKKTGIDLPGETSGFFPDPEWKKARLGERWYIGDDYNSSIGQGFITATPLQILNATAAIANGGTLYAPRIVSGTRTPDGKLSLIPPSVLNRDFIRPDILEVVREGMRQTVTEGTAQSLRDLPVAVAGKTGTAEFGNAEKTHGWFVSFAPFDNPRIAMIVLVEGQGEEGYNAVPITKDILSWYFSRPE